MANDVLRIRNMSFFAYHGLFPEEARLGQKFEVDVEIFGDFHGFAHQSLPKVVDYPQVVALVEQVMTKERYGLVEALADRIAEVLQETFKPHRLIVRVRKPNPPVSGHFDGVEVEVHRDG